MSYADRVIGAKIGFAYEQSGHFDSIATIRRQTDRDPAEVLALARQHTIKRAIGFSRGSRAIIGALAQDATVFERIALVIPPRSTTAGNWMPWLKVQPSARSDFSAEVLVVADRIDAGHPVDVAEFWAEQLGARLEVHPPRCLFTDPERIRNELASFFR